MTGVCDFLVSLSPEQFYLEAPVIILVEAKNLDLKLGLGQCVAEMVASQRFNAEKGNDIRCIYGASTTGIEWQFLKLEEKHLHIDMTSYTLERCVTDSSASSPAWSHKRHEQGHLFSSSTVGEVSNLADLP